MKLLIEVPDDFWDDPCLKCAAKGAGKCNMTFNTCPLTNAREAVAVIVEQPAMLFKMDGTTVEPSTVYTYAVKRMI
jgi:hypothetical protein